MDHMKAINILGQPHERKKQNKTKKNHFFNVMILTSSSRLINREQGMRGLNISDVVEERTVNPFCFSCNLSAFICFKLNAYTFE